MRVLVLSCSLNPDSRSAKLAGYATRALAERGVTAEAVYLRSLDLPLCDGGGAYGHESVQRLNRLTGEADALLLATPIYNYDANAAAKNAVELTGRSWAGKPVGFLCAAGGRGSYMSIMPLANSLMLDFRCYIVPRFVYATKGDFDEDGPNAQVAERIDELCDDLTKLTAGLLEAGAAHRASRALDPQDG